MEWLIKEFYMVTIQDVEKVLYRCMAAVQEDKKEVKNQVRKGEKVIKETQERE